MLDILWKSEEVQNLCRNYKKYLVTEDMAEKDADRDRCSYVWEKLYIPLYSNRKFWNKTNFNNYQKIIKGEKDKYEIVYDGLSISGDVLFNFKNGIKTKQRQKYEHYDRLIKKEEDFSDENKDFYSEVLKFCNEMNYSFHNFGLMPVDGNLQIFKETRCNRDRMDKFVYCVNDYMENDNFFNLTSNYKAEKKKILEPFFEKFNKSTSNYCREMYLIDDPTYVRKLILFGEKEIKDGKDVVNYMELAIEYWIMKDKLFNQNNLLAL